MYTYFTPSAYISERLNTVPKIKMTRKLFYFIPVLISLVVTSKVSFEYNSIATDWIIGMVCRVQGQEENSLISIQHGGTEKVTMTSGCVIKSNDTRLSISCIETGNDVMLGVKLTSPDASDSGTWNCSYGKSYDTVTFPEFLWNEHPWKSPNWETTFNCIVHQECNLYLWMDFFSLTAYLKTIDGKILLTKDGQGITIDDEWKRRIIINDGKTYPYLNVMLRDVDISDAGIYYISYEDYLIQSDAFIITIMDFPKQPVILLRNNKAESYLGPYELHCVSESKSQPMFTRKQLSFTWRVNGHNLTELQPCYRLSGPILTLCMDACGLGKNENILISCTAHDDGLQSNESEPFIVSASRVTSAGSAKDTDYQAKRTTWILVAACIGSFIIGGLLSSSLKLLVKKRCTVCRKEHREEGRSKDVPNETLHVNTFMMKHARPESEVASRNTEVPNDVMYVNPIMTDTHNEPEGNARRYEVLDHTTFKYVPNQYDAIQSKRFGQNDKDDTYEEI